MTEDGIAEEKVPKKQPGNKLVIWTAIVLGLLANYLFYNQPIGISAPVFTFLVLVSLYSIGYFQNLKPARQNTWLAVVATFLGVMVAVRAEPFTNFLNVIAVFCLTILLGHVFMRSSLLDFGVGDYIRAMIVSSIEIFFIQPILALVEAGRNSKDNASSNLGGVLRGLALALPLLLVFTFLFSGADSAFAALVNDYFGWLRLDNLPETLSRMLFTLFAAWGLLGGFSYAFRSNKESTPASHPKMGTWLGAIESGVVLGSVDLLFLVFVAIQFRYFFGGQSNIHVAGLTYSEYARRGFAELVVVAVFSLGVALVLQQITRQDTRRAQVTIKVLSALLIALTGVILVSAFRRLTLYEQAYGFTELRFFTHVFMVWVGVLLGVFLGSLLLNQPRWFAFGLFCVGIGFIISLNILNTDAFVVRQNLARYEATGDLDAAYLATLSDDAVPGLLVALPHLGSDERVVLGGALHYRLNQLDKSADEADWMSWNYAHHRAAVLLKNARSELQQYEPMEYDWEFPID